jgi:phage portal protein BeeE
MRTEAEDKPRGNIFLYGGEYQDIGLTNKDMEFTALTDKVRDRICGVYGVPPHKVGIIESGNLGGGTGESQDINFWKKRKGEIKLFEDAFNNVIGRTGWAEIFEFGVVDLENKLLRAQTEDIKLKNGTIVPNENRTGYNLDPYEGGDTPLTQLMKSAPIPPAAASGVKSFLNKKGLYYE